MGHQGSGRGVRLSAIGRRRAAAQGDGRSVYLARRAEIVAAAAEVFRTEGFRGTSIGRIAEAVDMDRATLHYYVGSPRALCRTSRS